MSITDSAGRAGLSRRRFLMKAGAAAALGPVALAGCSSSRGSGSGSGGGGGGKDKAIVVGSLLDASGAFNVYGKPMIDATNLAIAQINASGGVVGRKLKLVSFDTQSDNDKYTQYANELVLKQKPAVIMGAISSASRELIRPIMDRAEQLYFYTVQYEGGVCDKDTFITGVVPSQQLDPLLDYGATNGSKRVYMLAADFNVGHSIGNYVKSHVGNGMSLEALDYFPLDVTDFSSAIDKISRSKADTVWTHLAGSNQIAFYRQFAAAGLQSKYKLLSSSFGLGGEQTILSPKEAVGWTVCLPYFQELDNPKNKKFVSDWHQRYGADYGYIGDAIDSTWMGWQFWAKAANQAGSIDRDAVTKALESGLTLDTPSGTVKMDPKSHHVFQNSHVAIANDKHGFKILKNYANTPPNPGGQCDLVANPTLHAQQTW
jgi:urea transport system substrate-binding protein